MVEWAAFLHTSFHARLGPSSNMTHIITVCDHVNLVYQLFQNK